MKLSTKLKKYAAPAIISGVPIVLLVDSGRAGRYTFGTLADADAMHNKLLAQGCKLLPLNECPVYNGREVIMHYTTTNYKNWCNGQ